MKKDDIKFKQIGNTCGFYSLAYCLNDLSPLDDFIGFTLNMVKKSVENGETMVGEVFDIDCLLKIANANFSEMKNIQVSKVEIKNADDILTALEKNTRVVFPIVNEKKGTPHYISLSSPSITKRSIKCCNGGYYKRYKIEKLYELNSSLPDEYDWGDFIKENENNKNLIIHIKKKYRDFSDREFKIYLSENIPNILKKIDMLKTRKKEKVNMRGWCLQIKVREKHT